MACRSDGAPYSSQTLPAQGDAVAHALGSRWLYGPGHPDLRGDPIASQGRLGRLSRPTDTGCIFGPAAPGRTRADVERGRGLENRQARTRDTHAPRCRKSAPEPQRPAQHVSGNRRQADDRLHDPRERAYRQSAAPRSTSMRCCARGGRRVRSRACHETHSRRGRRLDDHDQRSQSPR